MPPRTVDNLGVDVSTRYAQDQKLLDTSLIKEARAIPIQTGIEVTSPTPTSELDALIHGEIAHVVWALFRAPENYYEQRKPLFTFQLIPSMGSEERKDSQAQKILAKLKSLADERTEVGEAPAEKERALEERERQKKVLASLFDTIARFDKLIVDINSRRSQYQKG